MLIPPSPTLAPRAVSCVRVRTVPPNGGPAYGIPVGRAEPASPPYLGAGFALPDYSRPTTSSPFRARLAPVDPTSATSEVTDEGLMLRYQRGDRTAFAELVRRYKTPVFNFVYRKLRSHALAEDITQDAFMRVVRNAPEFKHEARFSTWLFTIARNRCIDEARKRKLRNHPSLDAPAANDGATDRPLLDQISDDHPRADVDRSVASSEIQRRVVAAIDTLPDDQREVFLLREVANLPFREIATIVGTGENTVKSRMRYALDRLRDALSELEEYARALR